MNKPQFNFSMVVGPHFAVQGVDGSLTLFEVIERNADDTLEVLVVNGGYHMRILPDGSAFYADDKQAVGTTPFDAPVWEGALSHGATGDDYFIGLGFIRSQIAKGVTRPNLQPDTKISVPASLLLDLAQAASANDPGSDLAARAFALLGLSHNYPSR